MYRVKELLRLKKEATADRKKLIQAAGDGEINTVEALLHKGVPIDSRLVVMTELCSAKKTRKLLY